MNNKAPKPFKRKFFGYIIKFTALSFVIGIIFFAYKNPKETKTITGNFIAKLTGQKTATHEFDLTRALEDIEQLKEQIEQLEIRIAAHERFIASVQEAAHEQIQKNLNHTNNNSDNMRYEPTSTDNYKYENEKQNIIKNRELTDPDLLDFEKESLTAGLEDVNNRTVQLEEKLYKMNHEINLSRRGEKYTALLIATVNLRNALENSLPMSRELEVIKRLAKDNNEIMSNVTTLEKHAQTPLPNKKELEEDFYSITSKILDKYRRKIQDPKLMDRIAIEFSNLVSIRKTGGKSEGSDVESIIDRAENNLSQNDIKNTVRELEKLSGEYLHIANPWIQQATSLTEAKQSAANIFQHIADSAYYNRFDTTRMIEQQNKTNR